MNDSHYSEFYKQVKFKIINQLELSSMVRKVHST